MEILFQKQHAELLRYLPQIKPRLEEWIFADIRVETNKHFSLSDAAALINTLYKDKEGKLYLCNSHEMLLMIRMGAAFPPTVLVKDVEEKLPPGSCRVRTYPPTAGGLQKLEIVIAYNKTVVSSSFAEMRRDREEKRILIADDDLFIRTLIGKMLGTNFKILEAADGTIVMDQYIEHVPDLLLLDVHLPGIDGPELLRMLRTVDSEAYIVMVSADSSLENVKTAMQEGAKGFLAKPLVKDKLQDYVRKCPTL